MIRSLDVYRFALQHGLALQYSIVREALASIDREALEEEERSHWQVLVWDGTGDPPVGTRERWLHEEDAIGRAAKEAAEHPSYCMYWTLRDGKIVHFQPFVPYEGGHYNIVHDNPDHPRHHSKVTEAHLAREVEQRVDQQVLELALEKAVELHEQRGIPVAVALPQQVEGRR